MTTLSEARALFTGGRHYFGACSLGLAMTSTLEAMRADQQQWAAGLCSPAHYDAVIDRTRASFARLMSVGADRVAIGSQTSAMVSVLAAAVPAGSEVLCVEGDFSSMVFPFVVAQGRGVSVRHVPIESLAASITPATHLVVFSLVQSASGRVADVDAIVAAAAANGAFTVCDTTQAAGAMPVDASLFDATVCHAYKWLCAPRGAAFLTLSPEYEQTLTPIQANWYAGEQIWGSCYGPEMTLAGDVRRFDVSPAWPVWVGAEPAIELFASLDLAEVHAHNVALADSLCDGLGIARAGQAIVTWPDADGRQLAALTAAGLVASGRAGRARVAFHLWNDEQDVADLLSALAHMKS
jgi:selenocysteine lyase/cysteine desulfurase